MKSHDESLRAGLMTGDMFCSANLGSVTSARVSLVVRSFVLPQTAKVQPNRYKYTVSIGLHKRSKDDTEIYSVMSVLGR